MLADRSFNDISFNDKVIKKLVDDIIKKRELKYILNNINDIIINGLSIHDIFNGFINEISDINIEYNIKFNVLEICSKFKINYTEGLVSNLQLINFIINIYRIINNNENI